MRSSYYIVEQYANTLSVLPHTPSIQLPNSLASSLGVLPSELKQASEVEVPRKETVAQPSCHVCSNSLETWHDFMLTTHLVKPNSNESAVPIGPGVKRRGFL